MVEPTKLPVKTEKSPVGAPQFWRPFESLRREIDHLFEDFGGDFWRTPFRQVERTFGAAMPAVDVTETDGAFEVTADLPGIEEKNIEVKLANHTLTIKGDVDIDKIDASFKKGVLTVTLPKTVEAKKAEKKITVKVA
jgi:HSP20 family protein